LLSHAWAWNDGDVIGSILTREEVLDHDPERLVLEAWALFDNADIIVAHYGKKFDIPKMNGYFLKYGLQPPSPFKVVDTKEISSRKFLLPFNSLEYLAKALGVQQKIDNSGIQLWIDCDHGKQESLDEMLAYNIGDVEALRDVYNRLITWDNNGVNMALYNDEHEALCTHCGSDNIVPLDGKYAYTAQRKYSLYRCNSCKAVLRSNRKEGNGNSLVKVV
jgi:DNA polymerase III epsilon subunit-like protein